MDREFWLERWQMGQIGFHREGVNPELVAHQARFLGGGSHRVFVPLCGKSHDLDWLAGQGHTAVGLELSQVAVEQFHDEHGRAYTVDEVGPFRVYRSEGCELWCGDVFEATRELVGAIDRVWDRAALVALPPERRRAYAERIRALSPGGLLLQNAFTYDPEVMSGPPFTVPLDEVRAHYGADRVELLFEGDVIDQVPQFRQRGHTWWLAHTSLVQL